MLTDDSFYYSSTDAAIGSVSIYYNESNLIYDFYAGLLIMRSCWNYISILILPCFMTRYFYTVNYSLTVWNHLLLKINLTVFNIIFNI